MAKFSGASVKAGQTDALTQEAAAAGPVQQLQERVPQASAPTSFADLMEPDAVDTTTQVEDIAEGAVAAAEETAQIESERIPAIQERAVETTPRKWELTTPSKKETDGGLKKRAAKMAEAYTDVDNSPLGLKPFAPLAKAAAKGTATPLTETSIGDAEAAAVNQPGSIRAAFHRSGALENTFDENTRSYKTIIDPDMLYVGSAVVENFFAGDAFAQIDDETGQVVEKEIPAEDLGPVTLSMGNARLGREIHQEYQRYKSAKAGRPTDEQASISKEEAVLLGDAFKRMYAKINPDIVEEVQSGSQKAFRLTSDGIDHFDKGLYDRKRLFPKVQVRPSKVATKTGQLPGEVGRTVVRKQTGAVARKHVGAETLKEATRNLNSVPNVVDARRMRVLFATVIPFLSGELELGTPLGDAFGEINGLGNSKVNALNAAEKAAREKGEKYSAVQNYQEAQEKYAQEVRSIAMERKGANHLTYFIQSATGRVTPQQLYFNPTTSKAVRFATRNVVPAKATPGSRIARNLEQMYAMMLVGDKYSNFDRKGKRIKVDQLLPHHRIESFERAAPEIERWGDRLAELLDQSMSNADAEAIADAIEAGMPLDDPNFPRVNPLALDPARDAELIAAIQDKGEDGLAFIDGLIDAAKYIKAKRDGRPHNSYFNAYVDGKTNGIAANALQVGSIELATATGVIRTQGNTLLDDGDIRDQLQDDLLVRLQDEGFSGNLEDVWEDLNTVATELYKTRDLNKATTMTFPYGKELASFKSDIEKFLGLVYENNLDTDFSVALDSLKAKMSQKDLIDTLHQFYVGSLASKMDDQAIANRKIMRSAAMLHAVTDQLFTIKSATGFEIAMGGSVAGGFDEANVSSYEWEGRAGGARVGQFENRDTSAAEKFRTDKETGERVGIPGQLAYGQSVTSPVQSLDAATVALSVTGKTWDKMKAASNGNPYVHTIYDAFKFDAMGFDVGVAEVNKNWFDAGMNWSYLEETLESTKEKLSRWKKDIDNLPKGSEVDVSEAGEYRVVGFLLSGPKTLTYAMKGLLPDDGDPKQAASAILDNMRQAGYDGGDTMTKEQLLKFYEMFTGQLQLSKRLTAAINTTNNRKKALRKAAQNNPVLQYYAH